MKKYSALVRIALNALLFGATINAALLLSAIAFRDSFPFSFSLNVFTPLLCALVTALAERRLRGKAEEKA